jgi:SAM-dependent methyltransferase
VVQIVSFSKRRRIETVDQQVDRISRDKFLVRVNEDSLRKVDSIIDKFYKRDSELIVELGSAGGLTKRINPAWITTDVRNSVGVDAVFSAVRMPFKNGSVDVFYAQDVLHHIPNIPEFLNEVKRTMKPGGIAIFREPYWGAPAQVIWRFLHPEKFSLKELRPISNFEGPMDGNQALAWAVISKKERRMDALFDEFEVLPIGPFLGLSFMLSGGATFTSVFPRKALIFMHNLENRSKSWLRVFGFSYFFAIKVR